jgi:hypothetical protein
MISIMTFADRPYSLMYAKVMSEFRGDQGLAHDAASESLIAGPDALVGDSELIHHTLDGSFDFWRRICCRRK